MTIVVSISQFRQHIAEYIAKAKEGHAVIIKDKKKDQKIVELVGKKHFNPKTFGQALKNAAGIFTAENHPEWTTKQEVINWVQKGRKAADRNF